MNRIIYNGRRSGIKDIWWERFYGQRNEIYRAILKIQKGAVKMNKSQLKIYIEQNSNIDFNYAGKRYGIERVEKDNKPAKIFFWEWNNESTFENSFQNFTDFELNAKIDGKNVVDILEKIYDADVF